MGKLTESRKNDHIRICLEKDVQFRKTNGFEDFDLNHKALTNINLSEIDTSTEVFGKEFRLPFMIEAMTGGSRLAEKINLNLAKAAQKNGIGMGVGSQRAMLEDANLSFTYDIRRVAPDIFILGNIGAVQLGSYSLKEIKGLVNDLDFDGLAVHLNPAQELTQPEGDTNWNGVLDSIKSLTSHVDFPVIVKETGCGISGGIAKKLELAGASGIDIAGAGGTSFVKVEMFRNSDHSDAFSEWGIPTSVSLESVLKSVSVPVIASGGIRNGMECAKAIAMGAKLAGFAWPLLKPATESEKKVSEGIDRFGIELKKTMLLTGSRNIPELSELGILKK